MLVVDKELATDPCCRWLEDFLARGLFGLIRPLPFLTGDLNFVLVLSTMPTWFSFSPISVSVSVSKSVSVAVSPSVADGVVNSVSLSSTSDISIPLVLGTGLLVDFSDDTKGVRFAIALRCPYRRSI